MATATRSRTRKPAAKKAAPAPEPEELEDDAELEEDDELEELDEDEVEETAPKSKKSSQPEVTFGVQDIVKALEAKGHTVNARGLRTLIRKMARDGQGRVNREVVAGNRARYDWPKGTKDPEVKAIIAAFEGGELEEDKKEKLAALKARKAEKDAAAGKVVAAAGKKKKAPKKAAPPVVEEDDDDDLELEDDDE